MAHDPFELLRSLQSSPLGELHRSGPKLFEEYEAERDGGSARQSAGTPRKLTVYTLTIDCVWGVYLEKPCSRVIEMKSNGTLLDLHYAIQKAVHFENDHLFEFFIGRNDRSRKIVFGEGDDEGAGGEFDGVELSRIWPLPKGMQLFYWFDFGDDWKFKIRKGRVQKPPVKGVRYPRVVKKVGPDPIQYPDFEVCNRTLLD